jgi:hypothetical protein
MNAYEGPRWWLWNEREFIFNSDEERPLGACKESAKIKVLRIV